MLDLQKASWFKRIGAYVLDGILLITLIIGGVSLLNWVVDYDSHAQQLDAFYEKYEQQFGVDFDISLEDYEALTEEEVKKFDDAYAAMNEDEEALYAYNMTVYLTLIVLSASILAAYIILEVVIPLLFKNGQTIGKKIFGICLMHKDGVRVSVLQVAFRALLGKYTVETMVPLLIVMLMYYGALGSIGTTLLAILAMVQAFIVLFSQAKCAIHDKLCNTVVVDIHSQMIFDCVEDMIAYKEALSAEMAQRQEY